jgi:hypothetical protein
VLVTHLLCPIIVLRAVLKSGWLDNDGRITSTAFLRDPKHPDGLSVNIAVFTNVNQWLSAFSRSFGADSLHTGRVRVLGLEIGQAQQDCAENPPAHALIVGLPLADENPKLAEDLATELVKLSRSVDRQRRPKKSGGADNAD